MQDFEQSYNAFSSANGSGNAASQRGKFNRFLSEDGGVFGKYASGLQSKFAAPTGTNAAEQQALSDSAEQTNSQQFGENLNRINNQFGQLAQIGFNSVSQIQAARQAKEMAKLGAQASSQGAMFSAISSGIGALGSIAGAFVKK